MSLKDRTHEFRSCVESIRSRSDLPLSSVAARSQEQRRRLIAEGKQPAPKGEFARRAQAIGKEINSTTIKLGKLAQLAKRKTLFDDRPVEISELTYIIKHDIASINRQLSDLQAFVKANSRPKFAKNEASAEEHNANVVTLLQTKLASTTTSFKDILEIRTQNMKASKDRTEQFMYSASSSAAPGGPNSVLRARKTSNAGLSSDTSSAHPFHPGQLGSTPFGDSSHLQPYARADSPLYNPTRPSSSLSQRSVHGSANGSAGGGGQGTGVGDAKGKGRADSDFLALDMGAGGAAGRGGPAYGGEGFMQMQLQEHGHDQNAYLQSRSTAIESIESTISELGQIFGQLAHMVAEQRETVQRIDADTMDVADNVQGAQRELLKYYASVSSNRWLMLKIFGVLIIFFLLFILVS